jgi:preprotein translocase subunit SecE
MVPAKEWIPRLQAFWRETKSEMKKVSWPTRQEVVGTTGVVLGATVFFGVYLWVCDLAFYQVIALLFKQFGVST